MKRPKRSSFATSTASSGTATARPCGPALDELKRAAEAEENVFPALMEVARARVTVAETMNALADVLGRYESGGLS